MARVRKAHVQEVSIVTKQPAPMLLIANCASTAQTFVVQHLFTCAPGKTVETVGNPLGPSKLRPSGKF